MEARYQELLARSDQLAYKLPASDNNLRRLCGEAADLQEVVVSQASETRSILHQRAFNLTEFFLSHKKANGNEKERMFYADFTVKDILRRFAIARPLTFRSAKDEYLLRDGVTKGSGGFEFIGREGEQPGLTLADYMSYEEAEVAALVSFSGPTRFINSGGSANGGVKADASTFESSGVCIGMAGARLERPSAMEWKHVVVTAEQNTPDNGYGKGSEDAESMTRAWARFFGMPFLPSYAEAKEDHDTGGKRFVKIPDVNGFVDTLAYRARCQLAAQVFLTEANERAAKCHIVEGAQAFCHIVSLGPVSAVCSTIEVDAYAAVARRMDLANIGELHFSGFEDVASCDGVATGESLATDAGHALRVCFSSRDMAQKLPDTPAGGKPWLLVAQYPLGANSYPGNEFWLGDLSALDASGAAAACSLIPELHNPQVNSEAFQEAHVHNVPALDLSDSESLRQTLASPPLIERPGTAPAKTPQPGSTQAPSPQVARAEAANGLKPGPDSEAEGDVGGTDDAFDPSRALRPATAPTSTRPKNRARAPRIDDGLLKVGNAIWPLESTRLPPLERLHRDYVAKRHFIAFQDTQYADCTLDRVREVARSKENEMFSHCPATASTSSSMPASPKSNINRGGSNASLESLMEGLPSGDISPFNIRRYEGMSFGRPYNWILGTIIWSPSSSSSSSSAPAPTDKACPPGSAKAVARQAEEEEVIVKAFPSGDDKAIPLVEYLNRFAEQHKAAGLAEEAAQMLSNLSDPLRRPFQTKAELEHQRDILEAMVMNEELDFSFTSKGIRVTLDRLPKAIVLAALDNVGVGQYARSGVVDDDSIGVGVVDGQYASVSSTTAVAAKWRALQERALRIDEAFYGPDHVEIAKLLARLGHVYAALGDTQRQRDVLVRALRIQKAFYGLEHPENAQLLTCLAEAYGKLGDVSKQKSLSDLAVRIQEDVLGSDMEVAMTLTILAEVQAACGDHGNARQSLLRALESVQAVFGSGHVEVAMVLIKLSVAHGHVGLAHEQKEAAESALAIFEAFYGAGHVEVAKPLVCLANACGGLGDSAQWRQLDERALDLVQNFYGQNHPEVANVLMDLGNASGSCGDFARKQELLTQAVAIKKAVYGQRHPEVAKALVDLADAYGAVGDPAKQRDLLRIAIICLEESYASDQIEVAKALAHLGSALGALGDPMEHKKLVEQALPSYESFYGQDHIKVARVLVNLAGAYGALGDATKQKALAERAIAIQQPFFGADHIEVVASLVQLGSAHGSLGDFGKQAELLEKALAIEERFYGSNHVMVASTLCSLGGARGQLGDVAAQKSHLELALHIQENFYGQSHVRVALTLCGLSSAYGAIGDVQNQKDLLEKALRIQEDFYGPDHVEVAQTMSLLATAYGKLGDPEGKRDLLLQALKVYELFYGEDHVEVSKLLTSLGNAYGSLGQIEQKRDVLVRSLGIKEAYYGSDHVEVAITLINLANAHGVVGELPRQRELLERALAINSAFYGPDHVKVARCRFNLAHCLEHLGDADAATAEMQAAKVVFQHALGADHEHTTSAAHWLAVMQGVDENDGAAIQADGGDAY